MRRPVVTREMLEIEARRFTAPVDFAALEASGLLKKVGAWYETPNVRKLPDHVRAKIRAMKNDHGKTYVRFYTKASIERTAKTLRKAGAL